MRLERRAVIDPADHLIKNPCGTLNLGNKLPDSAPTKGRGPSARRLADVPPRKSGWMFLFGLIAYHVFRYEQLFPLKTENMDIKNQAK